MDYRGAVVFGVGMDRMFKRYGIENREGCELARIALRSHKTPVTKIVSECLRLLRGRYPDLRLVISYADPDQEHVGVIYQAGNWVYTGMSTAAGEYWIPGEGRVHGRTLIHRHGTKVNHSHCKVMGSSKHRYLMPLDKKMRREVERLRVPYPKKGLVNEDDTHGT